MQKVVAEMLKPGSSVGNWNKIFTLHVVAWEKASTKDAAQF